MQIQKKAISTLLLVLLLKQVGFSQDQEDIFPRKAIPIDISFISHSIAIPFGSISINPLHPGLSLGTEFTYQTGNKWSVFQKINIGYFNHKYAARAVFLDTELGYRHFLIASLYAEGSLGIGYLHSFHPTKEIFALNNNGEYEEVIDYGKPAFTISSSIGLGYEFKLKSGKPFILYIRYQPKIQMPYSSESPIYPHLKMHLGIRVFI